MALLLLLGGLLVFMHELGARSASCFVAVSGPPDGQPGNGAAESAPELPRPTTTTLPRS